jgi:pimeloyl-ACP methyl ester carboxylesterase
MPETPEIERGYVRSSFGQLHYAQCGSGTPVLMLHQTPRSWTEYLAVLPLVGAHHRAIAMDTLGYGASAKPDGAHSVERWAQAAEELADGLGLDRFHLVGHHTGGVIAVELAARLGDRVESLLLSGTPYVDEAKRRTIGERKPVDLVEPKPDGSHLTELWNRRREFYRPGQEDSLNRFMIDALTVLDRVEEGHEAVRRSLLDRRLPEVTARTLAVCAEDDRFSLPALERFAGEQGIPTRTVPGAHVPLPEQLPAEFARIVVEWATTGR